MSLTQIGIEAYWHRRHGDCTIDARCRIENVLLDVADAVVPEEPDPGPDSTLAAWTAWAERMRIRRLLLTDVL